MPAFKHIINVILHVKIKQNYHYSHNLMYISVGSSSNYVKEIIFPNRNVFKE